MECKSITIKECAAEQGGEPRYLGHIGEGDARLILWGLPSGEELLETNGEPVNADNEAFEGIRASILAAGLFE